MLTVGIGNSVFHTMCVIIATLFSNCILCKYCTFLFIIILVHVRYVFIKKRLLYLVCEIIYCPPLCLEIHGNPPGLLFKKHLTPSRPMGSQAQGFWVVHLGSGKTSKQLAALSPSAAANFGSRRRCHFLHPLRQAGQQAGIPPLSPKHQATQPLERCFEAICGSTHPPALVAPFVPAPILGSSCRGLLGEAGGLQRSPTPARPLVYHPARLRFELGHIWIFQRGFPWEKGAHAWEHMLLPSTPEIQAQSLPPSPLQELQLSLTKSQWWRMWL